MRALNMTHIEIDSIIAALICGDRKAFEVGVVDFVKKGSADVLWSSIGAAHGTALNLFSQLNDWPDAGIRVAMRRLMPAVAQVHALTLSDAVLFLKFAERMPPTSRHSAAELLYPHIAVQPELGRQLGEAQIRGDVTGEGAVRVWAGAFTAAAPQLAAVYAAKLVDLGGAPAADEQLIVLLQYLDIENPSVVGVLEPMEAKLTAMLLGSAQESERSDDAWLALTAIAAFSASGMSELQRGVEAGETSALVAAGHWLKTKASTTVGSNEVPVEGLARTMLRHAVVNEEARFAVDVAMSSLLRRNVTRPLVVLCVAELGSLDEDVAQLFPQTMSAVCEHQPDFVGLLTGWLLAPNVTFVAIRSLLSLCTTGQAPADLDGPMFAAATTDRRVAAAHRLLGLVHSGPVLCQFISVLVESPVFQPDGLKFAAQMLNEAFVEYPHATAEFLKGKTKSAERTKPFSHVYRGVYANALRWRRVLARLPHLNELRPADSQLHALRAMQSRTNREILRIANERSIFSALVTRMNIAQGHRYVARTEHGLTSISEMQRSSHAVELPSSELADPVGGMLRRAKRLRASQ